MTTRFFYEVNGTKLYLPQDRLYAKPEQTKLYKLLLSALDDEIVETIGYDSILG